MSMLFAKNPPLNILTCTTCRGTGSIGIRRCPVCRGMSAGMMEGNTFLYFGLPLTRYHIALRRARRGLQVFRLIGGVVFALGFLGIFFWQVWARERLNDIWTVEFWMEDGGSIRLLFWLSIIAWSYVYYRMLRHTAHEEFLPTQSSSEKASGEHDEPMMTWDRIVRPKL